MLYVIQKTEEFNEWLAGQTAKVQAIVEHRLDRIAEHGHFGQYGTGWKNLEPGLLELKWKSGLRVYFSIFTSGPDVVFVLTGGNKNGQDKDIKRARKILRDIAD